MRVGSTPYALRSPCKDDSTLTVENRPQSVPELADGRVFSRRCGLQKDKPGCQCCAYGATNTYVSRQPVAGYSNSTLGIDSLPNPS